MGDSDEESVRAQDIEVEDKFMKFLKNNRSLLSTSCTPEARNAKAKDLEKLVQMYAESGNARSVQQIRKTINNLRSRVKAKMEKSRNGEKPLKLSNLEQRFLDLLEADPNTAISSLEFGVSVDLKGPQELEVTDEAAPTPSSPPTPVTSQSPIDYNRQTPSPTSSVSSWYDDRKRKSFADFRRTELEDQMKISDAQYLAAEQQRIYYEQKIRQLRVDRLQTPTGFRRSVLKAQMKAADMQIKAADAQIKAADAQYLAAEQQRIYYEQKSKKLRLESRANAERAPRTQSPSIRAFPDSSNGGNIFKTNSTFQTS